MKRIVWMSAAILTLVTRATLTVHGAQEFNTSITRGSSDHSIPTIKNSLSKSPALRNYANLPDYAYVRLETILDRREYGFYFDNYPDNYPNEGDSIRLQILQAAVLELHKDLTTEINDSILRYKREKDPVIRQQIKKKMDESEELMMHWGITMPAKLKPLYDLAQKTEEVDRKIGALRREWGIDSRIRELTKAGADYDPSDSQTGERELVRAVQIRNRIEQETRLLRQLSTPKLNRSLAAKAVEEASSMKNEKAQNIIQGALIEYVQEAAATKTPSSILKSENQMHEQRKSYMHSVIREIYRLGIHSIHISVLAKIMASEIQGFEAAGYSPSFIYMDAPSKLNPLVRMLIVDDLLRAAYEEHDLDKKEEFIERAQKQVNSQRLLDNKVPRPNSSISQWLIPALLYTPMAGISSWMIDMGIKSARGDDFVPSLVLIVAGVISLCVIILPKAIALALQRPYRIGSFRR